MHPAASPHMNFFSGLGAGAASAGFSSLGGVGVGPPGTASACA